MVSQRSVAAAFLNLAQHECILETLIEQDLVAGLLSLLKSPQGSSRSMYVRLFMTVCA